MTRHDAKVQAAINRAARPALDEADRLLRIVKGEPPRSFSGCALVFVCTVAVGGMVMIGLMRWLS